MTLTHNAPTGSPVLVALEGTGIPEGGDPLFDIDLTSLDFGNVVEKTQSAPH